MPTFNVLFQNFNFQAKVQITQQHSKSKLKHTYKMK